MPLGPSQGYLAEYNSYVLPGYVQNESFESSMNIANHYATYADGSESEYTGLQNKTLSLTLKVWEPDYATAKTEVQRAATYLRSKRIGFAPLKIQNSDKYYEALVQRIQAEKNAGTSTRTLEYVVTFECRPWLIEDTTTFFSGTGTITTTGRTIDDGGWSPTNIQISGTNVSVSGYTDAGEFTGYFSAVGSVTDLVVDSDDFSATIGSSNQNDIMNQADYRVYVAPGVTKFAVTGASACTVRYRNRWYL